MDSRYNHKDWEEKIYKMWEVGNYFKPSKHGKPYTILMPPPNANASLHAGHTMYTIDDILIRWKRMQGFSVLWQPGMDHAGFETQYTYEKHLTKQSKSRMDFDREALYKNIYKFVQENSGLIYRQMKRLGFSADWSRSVFTLDNNVLDIVFATFKKMESEGYVYRDDYLVNYCTHCGTSLADLEVLHKERVDTLYYVRYKLVDPEISGPEFITIATVRPEPIFIDTHIAINPKNKKTAWLKSRKVLNPITGKQMAIIEDEFVDPEFGTGIVKLTPAHDHNDFAVAKKMSLPIISAVGMDGKILSGKNKGLYPKQARIKVVEELESNNLIDKQKTNKNYEHTVSICYKCNNDLEPLVVPNWYIRVKDLKEKVKVVVQKDMVKFYPKRFKKQMLTWLDIMHDWPISRQIAWGIRIPVWYEVTIDSDIQISFLDKSNSTVSGSAKDLLKSYSFKTIERGLQAISASKETKYKVSKIRPKGNFLQETDTFDTWFSSGQWPIVTLAGREFVTRFPTEMIGTLSDILKFWISRMILFSLYIKNEIPFKDVYLWSMVADEKGVKMSKSKGNVVNPIDLVDKYGADALRMAVIYGVAPGAKIPLSDDKVRGMRNFANKVWNMARFILLMLEQDGYDKYDDLPSFTINLKLNSQDKKIVTDLNKAIKKVDKSLEKYRFADAAETIYHFTWHELADIYIEGVKNRKGEDKKTGLIVLRYVFLNCLKLLHPFMPFVTEAIWQQIPRKYNDPLIISKWPEG